MQTRHLYFLFGKPILILSQLMQIDTIRIITRHAPYEIIAILGGSEGGSHLMALQPEAL